MMHLASGVGEERQTPENLAEVHEQLWQYIQQFGNLSAQQERNRIARDLHDSLGNALTALNIQLQTAIKLWQLNPVQAQQFLAKAQQLSATAIREVRQSVSTLRTDAPETQPLETLIESLVEDFYQTTGVSPSTYINISVALPPEVITTLYRILQEALNNICKYAQATEVEIQAITTINTVRLTIQDNGRGFKLDEVASGYGLQVMRERVAILGGQFNLQSAPGAGCRIIVEAPFQPSSCWEHKQPKQINVEIPAEAATEPQSSFILSAPAQSDPTEVLPQVATEPQPSFILSSEQNYCLKQLLTRLVGPIAAELIQQVALNESSSEALIENLTRYLPVDEQYEFKQQATLLLSAATFEPPVPRDRIPNSEQQAIAKSFIQQCEQELTSLIGPIATFLIQRAFVTSAQISPEDLVKSLTADISDPQLAAEFKQRLLA